jgi:hypothetical protein
VLSEVVRCFTARVAIVKEYSRIVKTFQPRVDTYGCTVHHYSPHQSSLLLSPYHPTPLRCIPPFHSSKVGLAPPVGVSA